MKSGIDWFRCITCLNEEEVKNLLMSKKLINA